MANIAVPGSPSTRRSLNSELPLVPFIDFLLCLVAFLLVTAVWSRMAQLSADANVANSADEQDLRGTRTLHVEVSTKDTFCLTWRENGAVIHSVDVPRKARPTADGEGFTYPDLAAALEREWQHLGQHRTPLDPNDDRLVLHLSNTLPFAEMAAVLDAAHGPRRSRDSHAKVDMVPAFAVALAID